MIGKETILKEKIVKLKRKYLLANICQSNTNWVIIQRIWRNPKLLNEKRQIEIVKEIWRNQRGFFSNIFFKNKKENILWALPHLCQSFLWWDFADSCSMVDSLFGGIKGRIMAAIPVFNHGSSLQSRHPSYLGNLEIT